MGGHAGHFSQLQLVMNLHTINGCSRRIPWSNAPDKKGEKMVWTQTDRRHTHRLCHTNSFGHVEVAAKGLTLLQPKIKDIQTDTMIALQALPTVCL